METQTSETLSDTIQKFLAYPFGTDETYQQGLVGILDGSQFLNQPEEAKQDLLLRSKVFYFNKTTGASIDVEEVRPLVQGTQHPAPPPSEQASSGAAEHRTLSFAELKELIEQGKTDQIPNNRAIPNILSEETPSASAAAVRKKPWEQ